MCDNSLGCTDTAERWVLCQRTVERHTCCGPGLLELFLKFPSSTHSWEHIPFLVNYLCSYVEWHIPGAPFAVGHENLNALVGVHWDSDLCLESIILFKMQLQSQATLLGAMVSYRIEPKISCPLCFMDMTWGWASDPSFFSTIKWNEKPYTWGVGSGEKQGST